MDLELTVPVLTLSFPVLDESAIGSSRVSRLATPSGEFHDQGDARWVVIRGQLRRRNDTPFRWPTPGQPIGQPGGWLPEGRNWCF
jgi:hypothetical protein